MKAKLLLILLFGIGVRSSAQILGGEINYRCLGNDRYEVLVDLVRSCTTQQSIPRVFIWVSPTVVEADSVSLFASENINNQSQNCPYPDSCDEYKFIKYRYQCTFDLSMFSQCVYKIYIEEPTTSVATTLSARSTFSVYTELNKCAGCPGSAWLIGNLPNKAAHNQDLIVNFRVNTDSFPQDSFSYTLVSGMETRDQVVSYTGSLNSLRPLTFFGFPNQNLQWPAGIRIDPLTGIFSMRPTQSNQSGPVTVMVSRFKFINGTWMVIEKKIIENHFQIIPSPNNKIPKLLPPYSAQACVGQKTCMQIRVDDDDPDDTLLVQFALPELPGFEIITIDSLSKHPRYEICFTPDSSQVSNIPYFVSAWVTDNACPIYGQGFRNFSFFARSQPARIKNVSLEDCGKGLFEVELLDANWASNSLQFIDSASGDTSFLPAPNDSVYFKAGTYFLALSLSSPLGCRLEHADTLRIEDPVYPRRILSQQKFSGCLGEMVYVGNQIYEPDVDYEWNDGLAQAMRYSTLGADTPLLILQSKRAHCAFYDTFHFASDSIPDSKFHASWQDSITLQGTVDFQQAHVSYVWTIRDSIELTGPTFSIDSLYYEPVKVSLDAIRPHCSSRSVTIVNLPPPPPPNALAEITGDRIYPNPFEKTILVTHPGILHIRMMNMHGQEVAVQGNWGSGKTELIPDNNLPPGIYWLWIETEAGVWVEKVVKGGGL